ncbi:hypothetical protein UlMin_040954 [Ulmus minor]
MYVTRSLSSYRNSLSEPPPEGPNSGYLVVLDEESETTTCFGLCKDKSMKELPFPQNKDLIIWYSRGAGHERVSYSNDVLFVPVINQPLSSNRYYVIFRQGNHKGEACVNSKEEDIKTHSKYHKYVEDVNPKPLDPCDISQQVQIIQESRHVFTAKSISQDGIPPFFLRQSWEGFMRKTRNYQLDEAPGVNTSLRTRLPDFNFSLQNEISEGVVVGKWYCPFMFVKEGIMDLKDQIKLSTFYEMTLEQRWLEIFRQENDNVENGRNLVRVDVVVQREEAFVDGKEAVWDERKLGNGVIWFRSCSGVGEDRVGLSELVVERMKWEEERVGWKNGDGKKVRVERTENFEGKGNWRKFGCYVLVESFVLKRMDGTIVLVYDFKHTHQIRCQWE